MAEVPTKVDPVAGARVASFPWARATAAVAALNDAATTLGTQLDSRVQMLPSIEDWVGSYRDEFNTTSTRVTDVATGLRNTYATLASAIVSGAETANQVQGSYNTYALDPAAADARHVT